MSKLKSGILKKKGVLVGIITGGVVVGLAFLGLGIVWYKNYKHKKRIENENLKKLFMEHFEPLFIELQEKKQVTFSILLTNETLTNETKTYIHRTPQQEEISQHHYLIRIVGKKLELVYKDVNKDVDVIIHKMDLKEKLNCISYHSKKYPYPDLPYHVDIWYYYYIHISPDHITISTKTKPEQ